MPRPPLPARPLPPRRAALLTVDVEDWFHVNYRSWVPPPGWDPPRRVVEATRLGQRIEQQVLIEPPHHDDPIESLAVRRKADGASGAAEEAANLLVKRWRGAPVQYQFGFAGAPSQIRGRKVEIGIPYCPLQLEDAIACDKDQ